MGTGEGWRIDGAGGRAGGTGSPASLSETRVSTPRTMRQVTACFRFRLLTAAEMELSLLVIGPSAGVEKLGCNGEDAGIADGASPFRELCGVTLTSCWRGMPWSSSTAGADFRGLLVFGLVATGLGDGAAVELGLPVMRRRSSVIFQTRYAPLSL